METKQPLSTKLLHFSADNNELFILIKPVDGEITVQTLTSLLQSTNYRTLKVNVAGVQQAVQSFTHLAEKNKNKQINDAESIAIARRLHGQLTINVDPLKMAAKAVITSAYGGLPVTQQQLKQQMIDLGIIKGIIDKNINVLIETAQQAKPGSSFQATIAKGIHPIHGKDAMFKRLVETPRERLLKPQKNKDGSVDMRNLGQLITVKPGTKLMQKIPYTEGRDGLTITGEVMPHNKGKNLQLEIGENTTISEQDDNLLISTLSGIPKILNNGMKVDDVLVVNNVDVGYGHVNYEGSVIIQGDVCDGMKVKASGDITIAGFVESSQLACGGDLIVGKGIIGHKVEEGNNSYSCEVSADGSVTAHFSQYARITAGTEVNVKKQLLHCHVSSKGDINVFDESGNKGTILGGVLSTHGSIHAVSLGASAGSKTQIDLIGHYPNLMDQKQKINTCIQSDQLKLEKLIEAQRKVDILPNGEKKQSLDARLMLTKEEVKQHIIELTANLDNNKGELQQYFERAQVIVQKEMFNDVYINIGKDKFRSARNYGPTKVSIKEYKISTEPYKK
ncbi:hypothetical protein GCM10007916_25950 [Psychromonas marina]|uniref:Flagellar Assembly Protein A N-terminal region domain-containing protein n=1 Tax=Psychromonas marina TaxID=88364 RepID=A0ABQ6E286_9GAMM|nr:FapA family protein [Psychromonas marina]GLS91526.1 hypothetical protein GCM10007916_25950 [Psychromonas marina]